jgi:hypothetical protein
MTKIKFPLRIQGAQTLILPQITQKMTGYLPITAIKLLFTEIVGLGRPGWLSLD